MPHSGVVNTYIIVVIEILQIGRDFFIIFPNIIFPSRILHILLFSSFSCLKPPRLSPFLHPSLPLFITLNNLLPPPALVREGSQRDQRSPIDHSLCIFDLASSKRNSPYKSHIRQAISTVILTFYSFLHLRLTPSPQNPSLTLFHHSCFIPPPTKVSVGDLVDAEVKNTVLKVGNIRELSNIYHSPNVFKLNYAEMERKFKVYIYPGGDPNTFYHTLRKFTGKYSSEGYFFQFASVLAARDLLFQNSQISCPFVK